MGACHFVVGGVLPSGEYVPDCINGNPNVLIRVMGSPAFTVIASCYLLIITYALTLAPVCWIYAAEVWSLETRATGMSIAALCNWLFNFALGMYIPPGFRSIRWGLFIVFGVMCILAAVQFWFTFPETCNKSLEEIEFFFSHEGPRPWHTKKGESRLNAMIEEAHAKHLTVEDAKEHRFGTIDHATGKAGQVATTEEKPAV